MEPVDLNSILNIYSVVDGKGGGVHNRLLGHMVSTPTENVVLSDYDGALKDLHGPVTPHKTQRLQAWANGSQSRVVPLSEIHSGMHPELLSEVKTPAPTEAPEPAQERWFSLERPDLSSPMMVSFRDGKAFHHGQPLSALEAKSMLADVHAGKARIKHHRPDLALEKAEAGFARLVKEEPHLHDALAAVGAAVDAGHLHPDIQKALHKAIFYDPMVAGVKNKSSWEREKNQVRPPGGVHVMLDGNDFGTINKIHGHATGDAAIKTMGNAIRSSMDETVSPEHQDLWRFGGDEFSAWLPSHEHAAGFLRNLRSKLEAVPPVGGTHQLSMSAGIGQTHEEADKALNAHAKVAKKAAAYLPGTAKMHVHSLVPGHEGHVPVDPEVPKPPPPAPVTSPPQS